MITEINWNAPIEAADSTGQVWKLSNFKVRGDAVSVKLPKGFASDDGHSIDDQWWEWQKDGTSNKWLPTIRNVAQTTPTRTPLEDRMVAPELVSRLVELARSVADSPECTIRQTVEAQGILAILDTAASDEIVAKQLCKDNGWGESSGAKHLAMKALTRGRQLEKEGK